jgi:Zn-finger domain-containing protein
MSSKPKRAKKQQKTVSKHISEWVKGLKAPPRETKRVHFLKKSRSTVDDIKFRISELYDHTWKDQYNGIDADLDRRVRSELRFLLRRYFRSFYKNDRSWLKPIFRLIAKQNTSMADWPDVLLMNYVRWKSKRGSG